MHKLMCTFMTPMKKKIPDRNLDTSCPAGIPCKKMSFQKGLKCFRDLDFRIARGKAFHSGARRGGKTFTYHQMIDMIFPRGKSGKIPSFKRK